MVDGYLRHSGSTAMRWCVSNATISGKENYKVKYKGQSKNSLGLFIALLRAGRIQCMNIMNYNSLINLQNTL